MRIFVKLLILLPLLGGCKKGWLNAKPDLRQIVPSTIEDAQALLDNSDVMNKVGAWGELACDDYYMTNEVWNSLRSAFEKNAYIWRKDDLYGGEQVYDWYLQYNKILTANIALETIEQVKTNANNLNAWNIVKGSALFLRAFSYLQLVETYCPIYNEATAASDLGVPLRLGTEMDWVATRASLKEVYDQIEADLKQAVASLPVVAVAKTRPSRPAANGLFARMHLGKREYIKALEYSTKALLDYNQVIDYNNINVNNATTFSRFNEEVIFDAFLYTYSYQSASTSTVDANFYSAYQVDDIRKAALFSKEGTKGYIFKGSYGGPAGLAGIYWGGLATDEMILIKAECLARAGNVEDAMNVLNDLMKKRYQATTFIPFSASNPDDALKIILSERRKELPYRGIRFNDLRRLNMEPLFAKTLTRNINGIVYELPPNDKRYVYPIPEDVIAKTGIPQNER